MSTQQENSVNWKAVSNNKPRGRKKNSKEDNTPTTPTTPTTTTTSVNNNTSNNNPTTVTTNPTNTSSNTATTNKQEQSTIMNNKHLLKYNYSFSYFRKEKGMDYEECMKNVGEFQTVEDFWSLYTHMKRPYELKVSMDYHVFKMGIKPMWEDEQNKTGGRWMLRCKSGYSARIWEDLLLAFVGQQFQDSDDINGCVISIRENHDIISIWNKSGQDKDLNERLRVDLMKLLNLPTSTKLEYKVHQESITLHSRMLELYQNESLVSPSSGLIGNPYESALSMMQQGNSSSLEETTLEEQE
ncbi:hypothetical protein ABK040_008005 [Willaertia magna]